MHISSEQSVAGPEVCEEMHCKIDPDQQMSAAWSMVLFCSTLAFHGVPLTFALARPQSSGPHGSTIMYCLKMPDMTWWQSQLQSAILEHAGADAWHELEP